MPGHEPFYKFGRNFSSSNQFLQIYKACELSDSSLWDFVHGYIRVCRYHPHKFLLFPLCWAAACSQTGSCVKNRSAGTLDVQLCCTPFSQGQVLPTELLDVLREHKPLLPSADLLLLWCPAACPPVDSAHPSGEGWKSKT